MPPFHRSIGAVAGIAALLVTATVFAAEPPKVNPADELLMVGRLGGEASGSLRLKADLTPTDVLLTAGGLDLTAAPGLPAVPKDHLEPAAVAFSSATASLEPGKPVDIRVTVKGFRYVGTYTGTITVEFSGPRPTPADSSSPAGPWQYTKVQNPITLRVEVSGDPSIALALGSPPVKIAKTKCDWDCWFVHLWANDSETVDETRIELRNGSQVPAQIGVRGATLIDRDTGLQSENAPITVATSDQAIPAGGLGALVVTVDRAKAVRGAYDGAIAYAVTDVPGTSTLAFELVIRERPAIIALFIAGGWLLVLVLAKVSGRRQGIHAANVGKQVLIVLAGKYPKDVDTVAGRIKALQGKRTWGADDQAEVKALETELGALDLVRNLEVAIGGAKDRFPETSALIDTTRDFVKIGKTQQAADTALEAVKMFDHEANVHRETFDIDLNKGEAFDVIRRSFRNVLGLRAIWNAIPPELEEHLLNAAWWTIRVGAFAIFVVLGLKAAYADTAGFTGDSVKDMFTLVVYGSGAEGVSRYLSGFAPKG